jgi:hypothetical protein
MKIRLVVPVIQFLNLLAFIWFNRTAGIRILALRQQLVVYKRKSKKPMIRNRDPMEEEKGSRILAKKVTGETGPTPNTD